MHLCRPDSRFNNCPGCRGPGGQRRAPKGGTEGLPRGAVHGPRWKGTGLWRRQSGKQNSTPKLQQCTGAASEAGTAHAGAGGAQHADCFVCACTAHDAMGATLPPAPCGTARCRATNAAISMGFEVGGNGGAPLAAGCPLRMLCCLEMAWCSATANCACCVTTPLAVGAAAAAVGLGRGCMVYTSATKSVQG